VTLRTVIILRRHLCASLSLPVLKVFASLSRTANYTSVRMFGHMLL
jgi:hypothetical protein